MLRIAGAREIEKRDHPVLFNVVEEMVDLLQATRTYDANVQAAKALKAMATQALNIGS